MCDASFQLYSILKDDGFAIQINRFGAVVTQIFPLLASKMNLSLQGIAVSYSLSFIVYYFTVFLVVLLCLKNEKMALVILLFNTIMVRHSFFWIQCEFVQGAVFTLLYLAITESALKNDKVPLWFYASSPFFLVTIIYFYPLLVFVMLFGMIFFMLQYQKKIKVLAVLSATYLSLCIIKFIYFNNYYDNSAVLGLNNILTEFPGYFRLQSFRSFFQYVRHDYYLVIIFWGINLCYLVYSRKYLHVLLMTVFLAGLIFLININYAQGYVQFYIESQFLILSIFVAMPFSYLLFDKASLRILYRGILVFSIGLSLLRIYETSKTYSRRVAYIRNMLEMHPQSTAIDYQKLDMDILKFTWPFRFETWMLSSLERNKPVMLSDSNSPENNERTNRP